MSDLYPTDEELARIATWSIEDLDGLWAEVRRLWHWTEYAKIEGGMWRLATGGWSGNESIIGALEQNRVFMAMCWQRSERGGLHWFKPWKPK